MNYRQQEKIDNYHAGKMTPDEITSFEEEMSRDPSLISESNFQKEIVDGLKEYRKSQLKARLDAIDIGPTWIEFAQQSTLMKSFGGVAVATMIGAGVYFYAEPDKEVDLTSEIKIEAPVAEPFVFDWSIKPAKISEDVQAEPVIVHIIEKIEKEANEPIGLKKTEAFKPTFEAPNAGKIEDEEALETASLDKLPDDKSSEPLKKAIDVDTEITKSLDVKYKYYDGKLFLSGDFDRAPYEILEINSATGRRIYVKYLEKYYYVETTDKLKNLPEVKNTEVIEELKLLRQHK